MFTIRACRSGCRSASGSVSGWWLGIAGLTTPWREVADGTKCAGWTAGLSRGHNQWRVGFGCIDVYCRCRLSSWTVGRCMVTKRTDLYSEDKTIPLPGKCGTCTARWYKPENCLHRCHLCIHKVKPPAETDRCGGVSARIFTPQIKGV